MNFRSFFIVVALIIVSTTFNLAQETDEVTPTEEDRNNIEVTTRISEFGRITDADRISRVDSFLIELQSNPGATGYIVFYQGKNALPSQYGQKGEDIYREHLIARNFADGRVVFLNAFRLQQTTEFWVVPAGQPAPELTNTIAPPTPPSTDTFLYHRSHFERASDDFLLPSALKQREAAMDEFNRDNAENALTQEDNGMALSQSNQKSPEVVNFEMFQRSWPTFNEKLKENSEARGVVIFYADDKMFDVKKIRSDVEGRVKASADQAGIALDKLQVLFGGYRSGIEIEMWVAPKTAKLPEARPNQRTSAVD
jgi:hypothetical protein